MGLTQYPPYGEADPTNRPERYKPGDPRLVTYRPFFDQTDDPYGLVTEASQIGIKPGTTWPREIVILETEVPEAERSGRLYKRGKEDRGPAPDYELAGVHYVAASGHVMLVIND